MAIVFFLVFQYSCVPCINARMSIEWINDFSRIHYCAVRICANLDKPKKICNDLHAWCMSLCVNCKCVRMSNVRFYGSKTEQQCCWFYVRMQDHKLTVFPFLWTQHIFVLFGYPLLGPIINCIVHNFQVPIIPSLPCQPSFSKIKQTKLRNYMFIFLISSDQWPIAMAICNSID